ncbi:undecaprenyldiphospho-muramoylpentapeptide beta-N-acetylglucosaminyltransferase [Actinomycetota bacterium]|nr:undecaprenyldiphospho-muramoylpentapeptide beta-N-acetylglucosaminyltransferase [Actinomycetota bacterium]
MVKFVLAAGGSAGHVYPAINTARAILDLDSQANVTIMGTERGLDTDLVPPTGLALELLPSAPFPRKLDGQAFRFPPKFIASVHLARRFLKAHSIDVVIGFGGYASAPAYLAAKSLRLCIIVHEANSTAGLANKLGATLTPHVAAMFDGVISGARVIGMPLSTDIVELDRHQGQAKAREYFNLPKTGPVLLVFGGSQGAQSINAAIEAALPQLLAAGVSVLHAVGTGNIGASGPVIDSAGVVYRTVPFISRMDLAYCAADLVVARAGAMTVAEIATVGVPAVFVPLSIGNGEQKRNAQALTSAGAAIEIENSAFTPDTVVSKVLPLVLDNQMLTKMAETRRGMSPTNAAKELAVWGLSCP